MANNDFSQDFQGEDIKKWLPKQLKKEESEPEKKFRAFLYHKDFPQGVIFTDAQEYQEGLMNGWVEAPWLTNQDPEKLAKQAKEKAENEANEKRLQEEYEEKKRQEVAETETADESEKKLLEKITKGDASDDEIREYAKMKKIESWHLKKIDTLKEEIGVEVA